MMTHRQPDIQVAMNDRMVLLYAVYDLYASWIEQFSLACRPGCAACCTQSVTMTSLEGELILDSVKRDGSEKWLQKKLARAAPEKFTAAITTNQFAAACLNQREIDEAALGSWNFAPCVFLEDNICTIYAVRPFGCRSFGSLVQCGRDRAAEITLMHLTVNTVFTQIIEHISSGHGYWSSMKDILLSLTANESPDIHLLPARPVPGFLLAPHEVGEVRALLVKLRRQSSAAGMLGDLIDNFLPI